LNEIHLFHAKCFQTFFQNQMLNNSNLYIFDIKIGVSSNLLINSSINYSNLIIGFISEELMKIKIKHGNHDSHSKNSGILFYKKYFLSGKILKFLFESTKMITYD